MSQITFMNFRDRNMHPKVRRKGELVNERELRPEWQFRKNKHLTPLIYTVQETLHLKVKKLNT